MDREFAFSVLQLPMIFLAVFCMYLELWEIVPVFLFVAVLNMVTVDRESGPVLSRARRKLGKLGKLKKVKGE